MAKAHHAIKYDKGNIWVHTKCNKINLQTYKYFQETTYDWYCLKYFSEFIPYSTISNEGYIELKQGSKIKFKTLAIKQPNYRTD